MRRESSATAHPLTRLHAAKLKVIANYPDALCYKPFTVSDWMVKTSPGGMTLAHGHLTATDAWEAAARSL